MPEPPNVAPVRGMRDLLPPECELRDWAIGRILDTYRRFGFARIETPVVEHLALLTGGQGGDNEKLLYKVMKRADALQRGQASVLDYAVSRTASIAADLAKHAVPAVPGALQGALATPEENEELRLYVLRLLDKYGHPSHPDAEAFNKWMFEAAPRAKTFHELSLKFAAFREATDELSEEGLRFDLTVPLARYFAANQGTLPQPFKAIQIGPVFRAERPQKGRFRQFTQCDIDVIGEAGEIAEAELILATTEALAALGLSGFTIRINDRRLLGYVADLLGVPEGLRDSTFIALDKRDKVGKPGVLQELAEAGLPAGCLEGVKSFLEDVQEDVDEGFTGGIRSFESWITTQISRAPSEDSELHLRGLRDVMVSLRTMAECVEALLQSKARIVFDQMLVRGMGYYTGPIFEISMEGAPGSIAGGGRYDRMIGRMLGREVPACGFSIGFERVIGLLMERGFKPPKAATRFALLYDPDTDDLPRVMAEAANCRSEGNTVAVFARRKKFGKQLDDLEKAGFDCVLTLPPGNGAPEKKWLGGARA